MKATPTAVKCLRCEGAVSATPIGDPIAGISERTPRQQTARLDVQTL